ncbi:MAG TPA: hypothetical protein VN876_09005 [Gemmatimonadaceae bacterium]|nr:hypothetical protein [Gemmatimonadaceae bacterium]
MNGLEKERPFWRQPEWVITLVTVVTSVAALALGAYTAQLQRRHDSASVWPHLEFGITFTQKTASMQVTNSGVGPAIVQSVAVSVDGRAIRSWPEVFKLVLDTSPPRYSSSSVSDRVIRAGEAVNWFQLPTDILPPDIQARIARVAIEVCYTSVYDEHWIVADAHAGQRSEWRNVKRCPSSNRSDF